MEDYPEMLLQIQLYGPSAGRVALISGASSGIGAYIAKGLAEHGASRVYVTGRRAGALQAVALAAPGVIIPLTGDVSTIEGCKGIVDAFIAKEREAGVEESEISLDLLVNNAGIFVDEGTWAQDASPEDIQNALLKASQPDWNQAWAVNVAAIQWLSAAALPYLVRASKTKNGVKEGRGCIVNNTSVSAFYVSSSVQSHIYSATKAAAESLTLNLASKFTRLGVRVNSIAPANIPSEINDITNENSFIARSQGHIPVGRVGDEEDVTGAVIYLASRAGSYISGTVIKVDGGILVGA